MYYFRLIQIKMNSLLETFRKKGFRAGLTALLRLLSSLLYAKKEFEVFAYTLSNWGQFPEPKSGLEIRLITKPQELAGIEAIAGGFDAARFYRMLKQGSVCFLAFRDGKIVGYTWASVKNKMDVNHAQPPLEPGDVLMHDLFVHPEYRNQGVAGRLGVRCLNYLFERGYVRALSAVDRRNKISMRAMQLLRAQHVGHMVYRRFLIWHHRYLKSGPSVSTATT